MTSPLKKNIIFRYKVILILSASLVLFAFTCNQKKQNTTLAKNSAWLTTLEAGVKVTKKQKTLMLIDFWATWCEACHKMERELFSTNEFKSLVKEYNLTLVRIDFTKVNDANDKISEQFGIQGLPTVILSDSKKKVIDSLIGFRSKKISLKYLKTALKAHYKK